MQFRLWKQLRLHVVCGALCKAITGKKLLQALTILPHKIVN